MQRIKLPAAALGLCLFASPALATGLAIISGSGTGGSQLDPTFGAGASVAMTTTVTVPPNSLNIAIMYNQSTGTSTGFTCTDSASNTYSSGQAVKAIANAAIQILYSYTTSNLASGGTVTCTQSGGPNGVVGQVISFSGSSSTPYDSASATATSSGTNTAAVGPTGTLNGPCGSANCEVLLCSATFAASGTLADADSGFTVIAPLSGSRGFISKFKIVSATTAASCTDTNSQTNNWAAMLQAFKAASAATPKGLLLQSVP